MVRAVTLAESATGHDCGLVAHATTGLRAAGMNILYETSPADGNYFEWSDRRRTQAGDRAELRGHLGVAELFFLARRFNVPAFAAAARGYVQSGAPINIDVVLHYDSRGDIIDVEKMPRNWVHAPTKWVRQPAPGSQLFDPAKVHIGFFRSCWRCDAKKVVFLAFKGGNNHYDDNFNQAHNNHGVSARKFPTPPPKPSPKSS